MYKFTRKQKGVSLIELLVSMVVALIILAGVISVVLTSRQSFLVEQEASFMQENARFAVELLSRDIRMAGSRGCAPGSASWYVNAVDDASGLHGVDGLIGYEGTTDTDSFPSVFTTSVSPAVQAGSDAIILRYVDPTLSASISSHAISSGGMSNTFTVSDSTDFQAGDQLVIVDSSCRHYAFFEANSVTAGNIVHTSSTGCPVVTLRVSNDNVECTGAGLPADYKPGSVISPYYMSAYYIAESGVIAGVPSLKRRVFSGAGLRSEEMAQGIEAMEILYGLDETSADSDALEVDVFLDANAIAADDWFNVVAVRVSLLLRSQAEFHDSDTTFNFNGIDYSDRYLRQVVTSTISIRNKG